MTGPVSTELRLKDTSTHRANVDLPTELVELAQIGAAVMARIADVGHAEQDPLTLTETGAAKHLGVSAGFFKKYVLHELRVIRRGARVLIPVAELDRWVDRNAARTAA